MWSRFTGSKYPFLPRSTGYQPYSPQAISRKERRHPVLRTDCQARLSNNHNERIFFARGFAQRARSWISRHASKSAKLDNISRLTAGRPHKTPPAGPSPSALTVKSRPNTCGFRGTRSGKHVRTRHGPSPRICCRGSAHGIREGSRRRRESHRRDERRQPSLPVRWARIDQLPWHNAHHQTAHDGRCKRRS